MTKQDAEFCKRLLGEAILVSMLIGFILGVTAGALLWLA